MFFVYFHWRDVTTVFTLILSLRIFSSYNCLTLVILVAVFGKNGRVSEMIQWGDSGAGSFWPQVRQHWSSLTSEPCVLSWRRSLPDCGDWGTLYCYQHFFRSVGSELNLVINVRFSFIIMKMEACLKYRLQRISLIQKILNFLWRGSINRW